MGEQEHDQNGHHVDERDQREMACAVPPLPVPSNSVGRHVGASAREMSGNNSALENGGSGIW